MCYYIFAPGHSIDIEYLTESVSLTPFGSSEITTDVLVKNASENAPLSELYFLLPKSFCDVKWYNKKQPKLFETLKYENRTDEIKDTQNAINVTYKLSGYEIELVDENTVRLVRPNPDDLENPFVFEGQILEGNNNTLEIITDLPQSAVVILNSLPFTFLRYSFSTQISPGEKRWIRIAVAPKMAALYYPPLSRMIILWLIDTLKFNYQIMGPFDVKQNFRERLKLHEYLYNKQLQNGPSSNSEREAFLAKLSAIGSLKRSFLSPLENSVTRFKFISIHIFPNKLRTLQSIYARGNIDINGTMPNYLLRDSRLVSSTSWKRRVYDWSSRDLEPDFEDNKFSIFFTGHSSNRILKALIFLFVLFGTIQIGILPIVYYFLDLLDNIVPTGFLLRIIASTSDFIFIQHPWLSFWIAFLVGILYTPIRDIIKKRFCRKIIK